MTFSYEDLLSINDILADVLPMVDDEDNKTLRQGWYKRQIRKAVEELNWRAPFRKTFIDLDVPPTLTIPLPSGVWDIAEMFAYKGVDCTVRNSVRLFHKEGFYTKGQGFGYTARAKTGQSDHYIRTRINDANVYFYNTHDGNIHLSESCVGFDKIRVYYSGVAKDIDDTKFIPPFAREAVVGYTIERTFFALKSRDMNRYRLMWADAKTDLYGVPSRGEPSKWDFAISMMKRVDTKVMDDMAEHFSKMNY